MYYGLSLGVSDLVGSPYLNLFISGFVEFPGFLIAILTLDRVGRRWPLAILMGGGGLACLIRIVIPPRKLGTHGLAVITYLYLQQQNAL